jgi:hypothetical protein
MHHPHTHLAVLLEIRFQFNDLPPAFESNRQALESLSQAIGMRIALE